MIKLREVFLCNKRLFLFYY